MKTMIDHPVETETRLKPFWALLLLFVGPIVIGAFLAPPAFRLLEWLSQYVDLGRHFTNPPFRRVLSRCVMIGALALLYPVIRLSGFRRWRDLGWATVPEGRWRIIAGWFAAGAMTMGLAYLLSFMAGAFYFRPRSTNLIAITTKWTSRLVGALLIGVLEETLFRGYVYGLLRRHIRFAGAVAIASLLFSVVHFARPVAPDGLDPRHWAAGFQMLPHIADGIHFESAIPMFINLSLTGVLLCLLYDYFGNIYAVAGLHAGWVWLQGIGMYLLDRDEPRLWILYGDSETLSKTWVGTIMLGIFLAAAVAMRSDKERD